MTGLEVQAMKEAEDARIWEEINEPDSCEKAMKESAVDLKSAEILLDSCMNYLGSAIASLNGTPMEAKVGSYLDDIEKIWWDIKRLAEKYERGERE